MSVSNRLPVDPQSAVVYQIYPRSFCDSNADGIGDIPGIASKLDYLASLGVNVIWLSPIFASPQDDNGYDISNYYEIAPEFGTLEQFDDMLSKMHDRGIRLMMDLVVNHTSDEHPWFVSARQSRDSPHHDFYIWGEPRVDTQGNSLPPTNWEAAFNGSVWEWNALTGQYYLHMFGRKQPDLNWENPNVRAEVYNIMRFWLDRGVDGFRMDVINMISKPWLEDGSLPDAPTLRPGFLQPGFSMSCNGPCLHDFLSEMRREVLDHYPGCMTVGEAPLATLELGQKLTHPETGALNMLFQFEHMDLDIQAGNEQGKWAPKQLHLCDLKHSMQRWQEGLLNNGWNSLYLSNHDQPRQVSRFGDDSPLFRVSSAKMLATWLHGYQGTPFIYQGEELGMTNVAFATIDDYRDIETLNYWQTASQYRNDSPDQVLSRIHIKSRDNARTPMPWTHRHAYAGFSQAEPWIGLNPNWEDINAELCLNDLDSVFHHYRRLIQIRQTQPVLSKGRTSMLLPDHPYVSVVLREWAHVSWLVVCNWSPQFQQVVLPDHLVQRQADLILGNLEHRRGLADERSDNSQQHTIELQDLKCGAWEALIIRLDGGA